jgi:2-C-methyl-D-erythritol 4-phosphate cytidylyltransferase
VPSIAKTGAVCAILAAGSSTRAGTDKITADLGGQPVLAWSLVSAIASGAFRRIVVVVRPDVPSGPIEAIVRSRAPDASVVPGGDTRTQSSWAALAAAHISAALVSDPALAADATLLWIGRRVVLPAEAAK